MLPWATDELIIVPLGVVRVRERLPDCQNRTKLASDVALIGIPYDCCPPEKILPEIIGAS